MRPIRPSILFYLTFMGMELSYLYLLASLLDGPVYSLILSLLLYPLALLSKFALPRAASSHRLRFALELALVIVVIALVAGERLFTSLATGQADVMGIILRMGFCGLVWWLGYTVPHKQVNFSTIAFRLQIGLLVVLIFSQIVGSALPVFLFFLLAPLALFLGRWANSFSRGATALSSPNPGHLILAGAGVLIPGTALILIFSPGMARAIVNWLGDISNKLSVWMMAQQQAAATPSGDFKFDFSCNMRPAVEEMPPDTSIPLLPAEGGVTISPVVIWIIVFIIFLAMIAFIALALRRRKAGRKAQPAEPVRFQIRMVFLNTLRGLISLFPRLLRKLWLWLTSLFQKWKQHPGPSEEALISIRALYRNLLRWAAKNGTARATSQTPLEHLELLVQKFPQQQDGLKQVTEAYLLARYSRKPVSQEEFDRVKKVWQVTAAYHTG
jgi:hypothetical protein